ncbi:YqhA family protein [Falsiroseomonas sp. HW251]|uniref:YqhA family protein n=1 Tax=Falsiroseomonas sp. HW251 TaxID=3390998 RepID=UPI003D31E009
MKPFLDTLILSSRWLLAVFFVGLMFALAVYAARFVYKLGKFARDVFASDDNRILIDLLHLLDSALVASLVVMVALASYDSLVSRIGGDTATRISWVSNVDPGNLKIKLSTALIAISAIHLLQIVMQVSDYDDRSIIWAVTIHGMFLLGILALGILDRLTAGSKKKE